ncbi:MAG: transglutaminase-like domain-containing protein [Acidimicrobiales bacterium]
MRLRRFIDVAVGVGLVILASVGYHRVFEGWSFLFRFAATAIVAAALVAIFTRGLLPRMWAGVTLVIAVFPVIFYLVLGDTLNAGLPTVDTLSALGDGFTQGWSDALNDFLPLSDPSTVTVLLVALVYAVSVLTTMLMLHTDRVVPTVVPALVLYAVSLPLAAPAAEQALWLTAVLVVAVLGVILLRANPAGSRGDEVVRADADFQPRRRWSRIVMIGGPMIAVAALLGLGASTVLGLGRTDDPFDPRDSRTEEVSDQPVANPLDEFKAIATQDPPVVAFELSILGAPDLSSVDRVAFAVLDDYDGQVWKTTDRFERFDEFLPPDPLLDPDGQRLTLSFDAIDAELGPYLPVVGRPLQLVDQRPVRFGPESGTVLAPEGSTPQPLVMVVQLSGRPDDGAEPESAEELEDLTLLPSALSPTVADLAEELTVDESSATGQLEALTGYLETQPRFDAGAPSGYSGGQIDAFLIGETGGNAVHYATAMTLMARSLGFPARVVVGWELPEELVADAATVEVTSAEYQVWSEVRLGEGLGWQAVAVVPSDTGEPVVDDVPGTTVPAGQLGGVRPVPEQAGPGQLLPESEQEPDSLSPWLIPLVLLGFVLAWLMVFGLLVVVAKRRRRRRRRRAPTPSDRILGAWVDSGDRLVETGVDVAPQLTLTETVTAGGVRLGDDTVEALREMLPEVGACAYSDDLPSSDAADRAWLLADAFRRDLRGSRSVVKTAAAGLNPRPLLRSRGR